MRFGQTTNRPNVDILIKDFVNTEKSVDIHTQNKPVNNIQSMAVLGSKLSSWTSIKDLFIPYTLVDGSFFQGFILLRCGAN